MRKDPDPEPAEVPLPVRGTEVQYYVVCPRKCWLFVRGLELEHSSDLVALGRLVDQTSFQRQRERSVPVGDGARIDFTDKGIVHEVKHSPAKRQAHVLQVAYYLLLLRERGIETHGAIHYPMQRRKETVELTPRLEAKLRSVLRGIQELRCREGPPKVPERMSVCRSCAYEELCWCEGDVGEGK